MVERSSGAGAGSSELMGGGDKSLGAVVGLVENWGWWRCPSTVEVSDWKSSSLSLVVESRAISCGMKGSSADAMGTPGTRRRGVGGVEATRRKGAMMGGEDEEGAWGGTRRGGVGKR